MMMWTCLQASPVNCPNLFFNIWLQHFAFGKEYALEG